MTEYTQVDELSDKFLLCRTLGHSWDDNPHGAYDSEWRNYSVGVFALRCVRCRTERYDYIGKDMTVAYRDYKYPKGYTTVPGEATRPVLRAEMFSRSLLVQGARRNGKH